MSNPTTTGEWTADRMVKYPFPLRNDVCCFFEVPRNLTKAEVDRIASYLRSIANE